MRMRGAWAGFALLLLGVAGVLPTTLISARADSPLATTIRAELVQWTQDFNAGEESKVCALFAHDLIANYQGQPERNYDSLCELLRKSLADHARSYHYALDVKEVIVSGDLAVVRLVWTLIVTDKETKKTTVEDEPGMDIFRRQADRSWKIARYMSYAVPRR